MINVEAENVRLWINERERDDGSKWRTYSISTSSKDQNGDYVNKGLEVKLRREVNVPEDTKNGALCTINGSLSNKVFTDKNGEKRVEHIMWAHEIIFDKGLPAPRGEKADSFEELEEDVPF